MEIELKFLLERQYIDIFLQLMRSGQIEATADGRRTLSNLYYDTAKQALRAFDIGLRTRASIDEAGESYSEQTVKLAGQDIGGLHQRPEFNIKIEANSEGRAHANLFLFDPTIWPTDFDVERIQGELMILFETNFVRESWVITSPSGSRIECVLDIGQVIANEKTTPICEIELELIEGQVADVFHFAQFIASKVPVKLGALSKAARGYHLAKEQELTCSNLEPSELTPDVELETALITMLAGTLKFIQHNELVLDETDSPKALRRIIDGISMLIHTLNLFAPQLPNSRTNAFISGFKELRKSFAWVDAFYQLQQLQNRKSPYRRDIEKSEFLSELLASQRMPDSQMSQAKQRFHSYDYNRLMLSFIQWVSTRQWRSEMPLAELPRLTQPLRLITGDWLDLAWLNLKAQLVRFQQVGETQAIEKLYWPLATELLTGLCVGKLYQDEEWQAFRNPLVDLLVGCEELMLLNTLDKLVAEQDEQDAAVETYQAWLQGKKQSLNMALSASIGNTLTLRPYWN